MSNNNGENTQGQDSEAVAKSSAYEVLERQMLFWDAEGEKLLSKIEKVYLRENAFNRIEFAAICKALGNAREKAVDAASKLINYQNPRLANMNITKQEVKRFVIEAPRLIEDKDVWLERVREDQARLPQPAPINSRQDVLDIAKQANQIEDAELVDVNAE